MEYRLGNLIECIKGYAFKSKDFRSKGIPIVKVSNLNQGLIKNNNWVYLDVNMYDNFNKYQLKEDDVVISTVGSWKNNPNSVVGKCCIIHKENEGNLLNQNAVIVRSNTECLSQKYLGYILNSLKFQSYIEGCAQGSASQASITLKDIRNYMVDIPDINIQNKTTKILNSLDKKIELNNQIKNNLYKITSKLYEHIFVTNRSEEWKKYVLMDIANIQNGYSYKGTELVEESEIGMATIKNFDRTGGFKEDGFKPLRPLKSKDVHYAKKFDVLVACTDLTQNADIIGNTVMLLSKNGYDKVIISMDLVKVVPKLEYINNYMLYSILSSRQFKNFALGYTSGTTVLHLNKNCFKEFSIKLPDKIEIAKFVKTVEPMYLRISEIIEENKTLEKLRDTLLSKLMNGEINLDNIEI